MTTSDGGAVVRGCLEPPAATPVVRPSCLRDPGFARLVDDLPVEFDDALQVVPDLARRVL
jgi:hypothetical protein